MKKPAFVPTHVITKRDPRRTDFYFSVGQQVRHVDEDYFRDVIGNISYVPSECIKPLPKED